MFDALHFAHQQHHAVCDALQSGQGGRVEFLMREHANAVKNSLNMMEGSHWTSVACIPARLVKSQ